MNSNDVAECLKAIGWEENYLNRPLKKYFRFRIRASHGWEYAYVTRSSADAMLCLHRRFFDSRGQFRKLPGVEIGGPKGKRIMQSADMLEFPVGKGRTGDAIPEYFPLRFLTNAGMRSAITEVMTLCGHGRAHMESIDGPPGPTSITSLPSTSGDIQPASSTSADDQTKLAADTSNLNTAEREAVVKVRVGQGDFRETLLRVNGERCWMSGIEGRQLLIASHIKPWSHCESDPGSRGNPHNGLLLSALWDAAFDAGLVTFDSDWQAVASSRLTASAKQALNLTTDSALPEQFRTDERKRYLAYHLQNIFEHWEAE